MHHDLDEGRTQRWRSTFYQTNKFSKEDIDYVYEFWKKGLDVWKGKSDKEVYAIHSPRSWVEKIMKWVCIIAVVAFCFRND